MSETQTIQSRKVKLKRKEKANKQTSTTEPHEPDKKIQIEKEELPKEIKLDYESLKKKTDEYNNTIITIGQKIEDEKKLTVETLKEINKEINGKNNEIDKLTNDNKLLFLDLRNIKNEVDKHFRVISLNKLTEKNLENQEIKLNKEIKIKEKEITNTIREMDIYKKEKEALEKILNKNDESKQFTLIDELNNLNSTNEKKEKEIKEEKEKLKEHKQCSNKIKNLINKLNLLRNEFEFEKKKTSLSEYKARISNRKTSEDLQYINELSIEKSKQKYFGSAKKKQDNLQLLTSPIWKELEKSNKKELTDKFSKNKSMKEIINNKNDREKYGLFSPNEFKILSKLIPEDSLNTFKERYNQLEMEKSEVKELFKENIPLKSSIQKSKKKIDRTGMSLKIKNRNEKKINNYALNIKNVTSDIEKELKFINEQITKNKKILKRKINENNILKNNINDIKVKIERGELTLKKEIDIDDENNEENEEKEENEDKKNEDSDNNEEEEEN